MADPAQPTVPTQQQAIANLTQALVNYHTANQASADRATKAYSEAKAAKAQAFGQPATPTEGGTSGQGEATTSQ